MQYIAGANRHQSYFTTLEDQVSADNTVRLIDAFNYPWLDKIRGCLFTNRGQKI